MTWGRSHDLQSPQAIYFAVIGMSLMQEPMCLNP